MLRAELIRTAIDFVNHLALFTANKLSFEEAPRLKKYIVFLPAFFFSFFGCSTLHEVYLEAFTGPHVEVVAQSWVPLAVSSPGLPHHHGGGDVRHLLEH